MTNLNQNRMKSEHVKITFVALLKDYNITRVI